MKKQKCQIKASISRAEQREDIAIAHIVYQRPYTNGVGTYSQGIVAKIVDGVFFLELHGANIIMLQSGTAEQYLAKEKKEKEMEMKP